MTAEGWHLFDDNKVPTIAAPRRFTFPFHYVPHPLAVAAARQLTREVERHSEWAAELRQGKMLGVLVARDGDGRLGFLAAFSGLLAGTNRLPGFVPPIYDLLDPDGEFKRTEAVISSINRKIDALEADPVLARLQQQLASARLKADEALAAHRTIMARAKAERDSQRRNGTLNDDEEKSLVRESQHLRAELRRIKQHHAAAIVEAEKQLVAARQPIDDLRRQRRTMSEALQERVFSLFTVRNARGQQADLLHIFNDYNGTVPPGGAGECCAPKLLQQAFIEGLQPLCMAEFWYGRSPDGQVRHHGHYYPACRSKCLPILTFMLQGLDVDPNPLASPAPDSPLTEIYDDPWLTVVVKPAGMLSVPGKLLDDSALKRFTQSHPEATGPMVVHRLDQETSGLLLFAKDKHTHKVLQRQWATRAIDKHYVAVLAGEVEHDTGTINLPLRPDVDDRPRQMVDPIDGREAVTRYRVLQRSAGRTRVDLQPLTGRTHQLRVHAAHPQGLNAPIEGDMLYGTAAQRLMLHAQRLTFTHPVTGRVIDLEAKAPF